MSSQVSSPTAPFCRRCQFYYITFDASFPYGCRALDFKSRRLPQYEVMAASQQRCLAFKPKAKQGDYE